MSRFPSAPTLPRLWAAGIVLTGLALCPAVRAQSLLGGTLTLGGSNTYTGASSISLNTSTSASNISASTIVNTGSYGLTTGTIANFNNYAGTTTVNSGTFNINLTGGTVVLKVTGGTLTVTSEDGTLAYTATGTTPADPTIVAPTLTPLPMPWNGTGRSVLSVGKTSTGADIFHVYTGGIRRYSADPGAAVATGTIALHQKSTGKLTGTISWDDTGLTQAVTGKRDPETGRGYLIQRGADGTPAAGAMRVPLNSSPDGSLLTGGAMADDGESLTVRLTPGQ